MQTILLIQGRETGDFGKGQFNEGLIDVAKKTLSGHFNLLFSDVQSDYKAEDEIAKYKQADYVIYQYPIYWFMMPSSLKRYMDQVFAYGEFFAFNDGPYGSGGLMGGRKFMLSTTWNAPEEAFNNPEGFFEGRSVDEVLLPMRKDHQYCGFEELEHFSCHNVVKDPSFESDAKRYESHLRRVFSI